MSYNNDNYNYLFSNYQSNYSNPVDILNIFGYIGYKMLNDSIKNNSIPNKLINPLILWCNHITNRLYSRYCSTIALTNNNTTLTDTTNNATLYYSLFPSNPYTLDDFKNSFYCMMYKSSWIGSVNITQNATFNLLTNMFRINTNTDANNNKYYYQLNIENTHTYLQSNDEVSIDLDNNIIIITNYTNHYIDSHKLTLILNDIPIPSTNILNITKEFQTDGSATLSIYLNTPLPVTQNITLVLKVQYNEMIPLICFDIPNSLDSLNNNMILYSNNQIQKIRLLNKNSDNLTYNILQFNNDHTFSLISKLDMSILTHALANNLLLFLTIEYINATSIIKPNITIINSPPVNLTAKPLIINTPIIDYTILTIQPNGLMSGKYYYMVSFVTTNFESSGSKLSSITTLPNSMVHITNIPLSSDVNVNSRNIYRSSDGEVYYLLTTILDNVTTEYLDNTPLSTLMDNKEYVEPSLYLELVAGNTLADGIYNYKITYYTLTEESNPQIVGPITNTNNSNISINNIPLSSDTNVIGIKIYRTHVGTNNYFLITTLPNTTTNNTLQTTFIDTITSKSFGF